MRKARIPRKYQFLILSLVLIIALGVGLRRHFEGLSSGSIYPVRFNAQIGENPALPILGVYDDRAENEVFWATGLGEINSEYLLISSSDGEWTGDLTSGEFQPRLALPAKAKLWQVFETGAIYSLPAGSLYGLKGQQTYLLNSLDGSEEYKSVLFDQAENLLFIIYQDQAGALRLKYVRPQGTEVEIYRFADAGYQLAAYDHTRQSLQVYYLGGDTYWQLNLITKELSESSSPLSSHLQVVPPAEQTYVTPDVTNSVFSSSTELLQSGAGEPVRLAFLRGNMLAYLRLGLNGPLADAYAAQDSAVVLYDLAGKKNVWESESLPADRIRQLFVDTDGLVYAITSSLGGSEAIVVYNVDEQDWSEIHAQECLSSCTYQLIHN